jgi:diacylglycerol kinase family enzyme
MSAALVILNPQAGGGRAARFTAPLTSWLQGSGAQLCLSHSPEHAALAVQAQPPGSRVVVVGGDGSVQTLLATLHARQHSLGLVPLGGGNDLARALGVSRMPPQTALRHALEATARPMDLGQASTDGQEWLFASSLAVGFDAAIATRAQQAPRWLRGLPRYLWATLGELAHLRLHDLRLACDGQGMPQGPSLMASTLNTPSYGSGMPAAPKAKVDDGHLDLLLAGRFGRVGALAMLPRLLTGTHLGHSRVQVRPFRSLALETTTPVPLAADGEPLAPARQLRVQVLPDALKVVFGSPPP